MSRDGISYQLIKSGVIYGFLRQMIEMQERFGTSNAVFCFDVGQSLRAQIFPAYKAKRRKHRNRTPETQRARDMLDLQISHLQNRYLPAIGYSNVFGKQGYEADDFIAAVCHNLPPGDGAIIISSDTDFYQLLTANVRQWSPQTQRTITLKRFREAYGIEPKTWAKIKAITGCDSDEVPGIGRVQLTTALKYVRGEIMDGKPIMQHIQSAASHGIIERNRQLVQLPIPGTPVPRLRRDALDVAGWLKVCRHLGMPAPRAEYPPPLR